MDPEQIWNAALGELELTLSKANFTTWFKNTFIASLENSRVIIAVPNTFTKAWFESKYHDVVLKALRSVSEQPINEIIYKVASRPSQERTKVLKSNLAAAAPATPVPSMATVNANGLNDHYTFESFIVGKGNELAKAAAHAVAENPGHVYNPLFIYGGVGLGKTHLLHAVGNEVLRRMPNATVIYVSCETFVNDFIQSIRNNRGDTFKKRYRSADVLLIDDIQFLVGKEGTQEEFFHTFNTLHQFKKQIVLTSDRPPKAIATLEQRLVSRFEWGMVADISQPDLETRLAILNAKCRDRSYEVDADILQYVASVIQTNVRELEGALNKLIAHADLHNVAPDLATTKRILTNLTPNLVRRGATPKQLLQTVAEYFDITLDELTGKSRKKELVTPRQITMYLMREDLRSSFPTIGYELGNRDHTTAMHAFSKVQKQVEEDEKTKQDILSIRQRLYHS